MPRGSPGTAKSEAHRERIAAGLRAHHRRAREMKELLTLMIDVALASDHPSATYVLDRARALLKNGSGEDV